MYEHNNLNWSAGYSSKGNQLKTCTNNLWYKIDFLGYEGAAEAVATYILGETNIATEDYVKYNMTEIYYNDNKYNGCVSSELTKAHTGYNIISLEKLFRKEKGVILERTLARKSLREKIKYVVDNVIEITGLTKFGEYLTFILEFDALILNEDRHFKNICVLYNDLTHKYKYCPIFDNGAAFLSDIRQDYPTNKNVLGMMRNVKAKPFSQDFDAQIDMMAELYGTQLKISEDISIINIADEVERLYGDLVAKRISTLFAARKNLYKEQFFEKIIVRRNSFNAVKKARVR